MGAEFWMLVFTTTFCLIHCMAVIYVVITQILEQRGHQRMIMMPHGRPPVSISDPSKLDSCPYCGSNYSNDESTGICNICARLVKHLNPIKQQIEELTTCVNRRIDTEAHHLLSQIRDDYAEFVSK